MHRVTEVTHARRHFVLILNPAAGRRHRRLFAGTLAALAAAGCTVRIHTTTGPDDARTAAAGLAVAQDVDAVIAGGGDGTINEVINGLAGSAVPLGILPLGTANVLAHEIGLPVEAAALAAVLRSAPARPVALGSVTGADGKARRFMMMAGIGYDAHVVRDLDLGLKRRLGRLAYGVEMARQSVCFGFPVYGLTIDGVAYEAASAILARGRHYGGPFVVAPDASLDRDDLQVCLFARRGMVAVMRYATALGLGRLHRLADVRILSAQDVVVDGPAGDPVQGDGDMIARLPVRVGMAAERVHLIRP